MANILVGFLVMVPFTLDCAMSSHSELKANLQGKLSKSSSYDNLHITETYVKDENFELAKELLISKHSSKSGVRRFEIETIPNKGIKSSGSLRNESALVWTYYPKDKGHHYVSGDVKQMLATDVYPSTISVREKDGTMALAGNFPKRVTSLSKDVAILGEKGGKRDTIKSVTKKLVPELNRSLTFPAVLNGYKTQRDAGPLTGNQNSGVTNELKNKKILDERRRWHFDALQLRRIKQSKRSLAPAGVQKAFSFRQQSFPSKEYEDETDFHSRKSFDGRLIIRRFKRDGESSENKIAKGRVKNRLPTAEEVYKRLTTLDVVFYMPLNMTFNVSDSNATSDGLEKCMTLLNELFKDVKDDGKVYCNSSWDEVSCWPRTLAGTVASVPCPGYLTGINDSNNATKFCHANGTWADKAVYDFCLGSEETKVKPESDHMTAIRIIYNVGFTVSTLTLAIALFIFLYFRSLRCLRNLIHCHLIVTFIISNIIWIAMRHTLMYMQSPSMAWLCKTLISLYSFSHATNFFWMFVEGLYLHIIIVWTYSADKIKLRYLVVIGWGLPAINVVFWIFLRLKFANDQCWLPNVDDISEYDFAMIGPILLVLFANIIFLSTIVWVLITKLRASHSLETRQYRKAVRATVILFPLLGITYVLFIMPPSDHPQVKIVFKYINAILQSFQGLLVAVFYCFLNGEVKTVLKKKLSRYTDARNLSTKYTKTSVVGYYGNSTAYGNGVVDQKRRLNGSCEAPQPESIPLTDTKVTEEINES